METTATALDLPRSGVRNLAGIAVRVAALWLFAGAFFKLFFGNPNLIPPLVKEHTPFGLILTYELAISIELAIVALAMLKPRVGWIAITPLFAFFMVLLGDMVLKGETNCGCFGKAFELHPLVMMSIDALCLGFVLVTRPWSASFGRGAPWGAVAAAMAAGIALPWILIGDKSGAGTGPSPVPSVGNGAPGTNGGATTTPAKSGDVWMEWRLESWIGKSIYDVAEFTKFVPVESIPSEGRIVLWRQSCTHCAKHLREMAGQPDTTTPILLVQVMDDLKSDPAVDAKPGGPNVTEVKLPMGAVGLFETPAEIRLEGGNVTAVLHEKDFEAARAK
jgi:hypothetical protein